MSGALSIARRLCSTPDVPPSKQMIRIDHSPCDEYREWLAASNAFLDSPAWGEVLRAGFSAETRYVWDGDVGIGHLLAIFRRGPFTIGYLGFPLCLDARANAAMYALDDMILAIERCGEAPDVLRVPLSPFGGRHIAQVPHSKSLTLETCITDLDDWSATATAKRRRYLSVARNRCKELTVARDLSAEELFSLYRAAVRRNQGAIRYRAGYFRSLSNLKTDHLVALALRSGDSPVAMVVTAKHGDYACYLHGGTLPSASGMGGSDLLMAESIRLAQEARLRRYNFLASPLHQPGLSKFKEKWGGVTRTSVTAQIAFGLKGRLLTGLLAAVRHASTLRAKTSE